MQASVGTLIAAPDRVKGIFVDKSTKIARLDRPLAASGPDGILPAVGALAVLGGTGPEGLGLALRFAAAGETVVVGSRDAARAVAAAETIRTAVPAARVSGAENGVALASAERVILAFPFGGLAAFLAATAGGLAGKLVIDVIVPLGVRAGFFELAPVPGAPSVGELIQQAAPGARVVSAFKNLSAEKLRNLATPVDGDVVVCGNDASARAEVARLVALIPRLRAVDAGGIANARYLEAITALLLNLNRRHAALTSIAILGLD
jgi:NADPH-dependent F420 reductase